MSSPLIARIAIESPLPQLDRLFDYAISPVIADEIKVGQRVKVAFGRSKTKNNGFVIELVDSSEHGKELTAIDELVSEAAVLRPNIYALCRQIADRQSTSISDVLRLAVPNRSVAVEKKWLAAKLDVMPEPSGLANKNQTRTTEIVQPFTTDGPNWAKKLAKQASAQFELGNSTILCVPDLADIRILEGALAGFNVEFASMHSELKGSESYSVFLRSLQSSPIVLIGNRNALFAPVHNLGLIALWDDGDHSHIQQQSPYIHSRDIALMRAQIDNCSIHFAAHVRSTEISRLVQIGYLKDQTEVFALPKVANSESAQRLDTAAWLAIREASATGPVLVQVAAKGNSTSLYCSTCSERASCSDCNGPLWINEKNQNTCRWCNRISIDARCGECGAQKFRQGRAGATRTSAEIGKMFPGTKILTSSGPERLQQVDDKPKVVVSTPGAEPVAAGGYKAVVLLDADQLLRRDTMRATEDAVRAWSNAIALMSPQGRALIVGLSGRLATDLSLWNQAEIASRELESRIELGLPPALRVATIVADRARLEECSAAISAIEGVEIFGPSMRDGQLRLLIKFSFSAGAKLSEALKILTLSSGGAIVNQKSGRAQRALKIKIDDPEVI